LTRRIGAFGEYFFYEHQFDDAAFLIQGAPADLSRQGVRVGLRISLPLLTVRP
jgi:hypothetical protein